MTERSGSSGTPTPIGAHGQAAPRHLSLRTLASLKSSAYRVYWSAMMAQMGAMNMQLVARSLLMYEITGSKTLLGANALANALPMLLLSLFGGVIADRVRKKHVLVAGQAASALVALGIGLMIITGVVSWVYLLAAGFVQGMVMALMMPSRQSIVPELVGRDDLMNALSLNAAGMNINRILAPVAAGFLVEAFGGVGAGAYAPVYFSMAGLYVLATLIIAFLPRTGVTSIGGKGALSDMVEGLRYLRYNTTVLGVLAITLVAVIFSMPYMFLLPVFTTDIWHVGAGAYGTLMGVSGVGAIGGSLVLASLANRRRGLIYMISLIGTGVALVTLAFTPWYQMALIVMVFVGLGQAGRMALSNTLVQYYTEDAYRGRMMSIYMMEFGLQSIGTFSVAILSEYIGVQWAIGGCALALVLLATLALVAMPRLRRLD